jgi:hypothetical protein
MNGALQTLANLAVTQVGLKGIDWDTLSAQGRGSVWDRDYITNYMVPAQQRMQAILATLDLNVIANPIDFQDNFTLSQDAMIDVGQFVVSLGNPIGVVAMKTEARLTRESLRYLTTWAAQSANFGLLLHQDETIHHSGKTDAEIAAHADVVVGMMNCIAILNAGGLYSLMGVTLGSTPPAAAPASTAGFGLGVIEPAVVVIAVAIAAILAWMIVHIYDLYQVNSAVSNMCKNAQASGDTATTQLCVNTLTAASKDIATLVPPGTVSAILKEVLPYALAGVGIYMLLLFAPTIVKSLAPGRTASA